MYDTAIQGSISLAAQILDTAVLLNVSPDPAERQEILDDFIAETRSDLAELESAMVMHDFAESVRLAHSIKGACAMVGAVELAEICATIERLGRLNLAQSPDSARAAFDRLAAFLDEQDRGCRCP